MQDDSSGHIVRLLELLPGFTLRDVWETGRGTTLSFSISSLPSLAVIEYCASGGNVALNSMTDAPRRPISGWADPERLRFDLIASSQENLQLFGIYLVWYLFEASLLDLDAANQLLDGWGGARVPVWW
jgi:hypothetical protein